MTVLLIDASGHTREMEIPQWVAVIRIAVLPSCDPTVTPCRCNVSHPIADFVYSDEPSYPPVYRQKAVP